MADYGQPAQVNQQPMPAAAAGQPADAGADQWTIAKLRKRYLDFVGAKRDEIKEQRSARHYYHGDQWTAAEIAELNKRKQPVVTYNRVGRKINGVVGLLERLRQDPKAYPRTPKQAEGADLATAVLRYALDEANWESKSAGAARTAAMEGQGGVALTITQGDHGDPEIDLDPIDNDLFFYDERSFRDDYSDAMHMGMCKWLTEETAKELFPHKSAEIDNLLGGDGEFDSEATRDRSTKWINSTARQIRVVDHWYKHQGEWCWCLYAGNTELDRGVSPYADEKRKTFCRYIMFAASIDHDGDRYGFVRHLKSAQDEVNHRRSKALFELMGRRLIVEKGSLDDVEKTRREAVRPDGVIEYNPGLTPPAFDDMKSEAAYRSQVELLGEAKDEIDNFGPNPALIGQSPQAASGRSIALQQQSGLAELGPFIVAHRNWKIRVYRAVWNAVQGHWTAERYIRVTDDEGLAQFIQVNGTGLDESGQPVMVNALGALDVDIILDEGPDTINMQADAYEALTGMGPAFVEKFPEAFVELAPLPENVKKGMRDKIKAMEQPDPSAEQAKQVALASEQAKVAETQSKTLKNIADAHASGQPDMGAPQAAPGPQGPKPPTVAINFKDMPPEAQAQALAEAGILIHPQVLAVHAQNQAMQAAALKVQSRPQPPAPPAP